MNIALILTIICTGISLLIIKKFYFLLHSCGGKNVVQMKQIFQLKFTTMASYFLFDTKQRKRVWKAYYYLISAFDLSPVAV